MYRQLNPALASSKQSYISNTYMIDCSLGVNPFGPPPQVLDYAKEYSGEHLGEYYNYQHIVALTAKISDYIGVNGANIFLANGSFNMLTTIFFKLLRGGEKKMLGVGPQFVDAIGEWQLAGGTYTSIPLNLDGAEILPLDALMKRVAVGDITLVYLDNPNNPTGYYYPLVHVQRLARCCRDHGVLLVVDEAYADFVESNTESFSLVDEYENVIVVRSFSKGFGLASIRLGYAAVHKDFASYFRRITTPFRCSYFSLGAASVALENLEHIDYSRAQTRVFKKRMINLLARHDIHALPTNNDVPIFVARQDGENLHQKFLSQSIVTEPGSCFAPTLASFDDTRCRIRILGSEHHFAHLSYRLNLLRAQRG